MHLARNGPQNCGPAGAAQVVVQQARPKKQAQRIRRAATGLPTARRRREPGSYKVSGSRGNRLNDGAARANPPGKPQPRGAATANRPRSGATAWSPSGDATNSTVHVRERNSRFFAHAGSTRQKKLISNNYQSGRPRRRTLTPDRTLAS